MFKIKRIVFGLSILVLVGIFLIIFLKNQESIEIISENKLADKTELKIGYITDLHCYSKLNSKTSQWETNWRCSQPMANFKKQMEESYLPDVIVEGGDMVDGRDDQEKILYPVLFDEFEEFDAPIYHIIGNHEMRGFTKSDWLKFTGYEKPYYFKDVREYRLIFLDGNNKPAENGQSIDTSPDLHYYPGHLDQVQKNWLEETLRNSEDKTVLVFVHQPPLEKTILKTAKDLFVEGDQIRALFSQYGVKAVFSGHIEEQCYIQSEGVDYYVLEGVHKSNRQLLSKDDYKDKGVFYEITIMENDKMKVEMFFKDKDSIEYNTLMVNGETAVCNEQSIQDPQKYKASVSEAEIKKELEDEYEDEEDEEDLNN